MSDAPPVKMMRRAHLTLKRAESFGAHAIVAQACIEGDYELLRSWERELPGDIAFLRAVQASLAASRTATGEDAGDD